MSLRLKKSWTQKGKVEWHVEHNFYEPDHTHTNGNLKPYTPFLSHIFSFLPSEPQPILHPSLQCFNPSKISRHVQLKEEKKYEGGRNGIAVFRIVHEGKEKYLKASLQMGFVTSKFRFGYR